MSEAAELRANPGRWGRLADFPIAEASRARSLAANVKGGKVKAFAPTGAFDARHEVTDTAYIVWAAYIGAAS